MKRIAGAFGMIGGIVAVIWAMRDRLVSIAAPREPEPPRFRVVPPSDADGAGEDTAAPDGLTAIRGIGPVYAERLHRAGIDDIATLAVSDPQSVADAAVVSVDRANGWIEEAGGTDD
jgi:predicted flap endonuclease-1-like 5' DNA nuclease